MSRILRIYLLLLTIVLIISTAGCIGSPASTDTDPPLEKAYDTQIAATQNLTTTIESHTLAHYHELRALAAAEERLNATDPKATLELNEYYYRTPDIASVLRLDTGYTIVAASPARMESFIGTTVQAFENSSVLYSALTPDSIQFSHLTEPILENYRLMFSIPLKNGNETIGYILSFSNYADYFAQMVQQFETTYPEYAVWMADDAGKLLYSTNGRDRGNNINSPEGYLFNSIADRLLTETAGIAEYTGYLYSNTTESTMFLTWSHALTEAGDMIVIVGSEMNNTLLLPTPALSTELTLTEFVEEAYVFAETVGEEAALAEFNNPTGMFTTDQYYIAAFDMNGTLLANPYLPAEIGKNIYLHQDQNGVSEVQMFAIRAGQGGGSVLHVMNNPGSEDLAEQMKLSYVLPVDDSWYIVAGEYLDPVSINTNISERTQVTLDLRNLQDLMQTEGIDAVIESAETDGMFAGYPWAILNRTGTVVSSSFDPDVMGTNHLGATDVYGSSVVRDLIRLAAEGGGRQYLLYHGNEVLVMVEPLNEELFIVSGVPLI